MRWKWICFLLALTLVLSLTIAGCGHKAAQNPTGNAAGGQAQVNQNGGGAAVNNGQGATQGGATATQGGAAVEWPAKMPSDVPKFTSGTIISVSYNSDPAAGNSIYVNFQGVTPDALDSYQNDLKNAGWTIMDASKDTSDNGFSIDATIGGGHNLSVDIAGDGTGTLTFTQRP